MAKIVRYNGNLVPFASGSLGTERTIFGEVTQANDITSQFTADFLRGWGIVGPSDQPTLQDFNAVSYTNGLILAYLHQMGIAEYNALQEYHLGSITQTGGVVYSSLINNNTGNTPASSPSQWSVLSSAKIQRFTGSGSLVVPIGVTTMFLSACAPGGGGGAGGAGGGTTFYGAGGGGGGAGQSVFRQPYTVVPGQTITITIGSAGVGGLAASGASAPGTSGGNITITNLSGGTVSLTGGTGGGVGASSSGTSFIPGGAGGAGYPAGGYGGDTDGLSATCAGGYGASNPFGGGGGNGRASTGAGVPGAPAFGFGSGGGGGGGSYTKPPTSFNGGSGGNGAGGIVILEY